MMQVKKYIAPTFAEALIMAKQELGTDAMIVESKKLKVGGFLGMFQRQMTELTVAVDQPAPPKPPVQPAPKGDGVSLSNLEREVAALRSLVSKLADGQAAAGPPAALPKPPLQGYARRVYETLLVKGVEEPAAQEVAARIRAEGEEGRQQVRQELARLIGPGTSIELKPGHRKVVALVGPTGVGKTTTLAKLAAHFALHREARVGLMTSDTYRIAAIDQLRTYSDILGIPLYAVDTPSDTTRAIKDTAQCDLVLVDTGGCNHKDEKRMQELRELLQLLRPDETHLVFSLTLNPRDAYEALDYYLPVGVNRLTFTKLDEASAPGLMLNLRMRCAHPIGYLAHGQSVPEDITPADQADFAQILLGG